jgi:hypothetical protein
MSRVMLVGPKSEGRICPRTRVDEGGRYLVFPQTEFFSNPQCLGNRVRYIPTSPDDVRRHLVAYAEVDSRRERLQRAYGLKGRGEFSDRMESDEEWDSRPE